MKTILPLSEELNDVLGMIFEANPRDRISIGELKHRIHNIRTFTTTAATLPTPPQSPCVSAQEPIAVQTPEEEEECFDVAELFPEDASLMDEDLDTFSDNDSDVSLTESCSTLSDGSDRGYDSGYDSPIEPVVDRPMPEPKVERPAPLKAQYVLPSQEFHNLWSVPQKTPWTHCAFEPCYEPFQSVYPGAYPNLYPSHPLYPSPFQFANHCY